MKAPRALVDVSGNRYEATASATRRGVAMTFDGANRYRCEFGEPLSGVDKARDELILAALHLEKKALPFGLRPRDRAATVIAKIGRKPFERSNGPAFGEAWYFRRDDIRLIVALDHGLRLLWLRAARLTKRDKDAAALKKELRAQSTHIRAMSAQAVRGHLAKLPTIAWRRRMAVGDTSFTDAGIDQASAALRAFLTTVAGAAKEKNAATIHGAVKRVVRALNGLNGKAGGGLIETMEREELCTFIHDVVRATGFEVPGRLDLTEQWRAW
jgi:hypothetical protein